MAPPFVPRDVFRLLVRLEAQKTHDVDAEALERRFHVPIGYAADDAAEQRERKAKDITPGPGAYDAPECWVSHPHPHAHASSVFASRAPRDPFQLAPLTRSHSRVRVVASPRRPAPTFMSLRHSASAATLLAAPPPLGSFARADRQLSTATTVTSVSPVYTTEQIEKTGETRRTAARGVSFDRAPRATHVAVVPPCALGPAQYDVKRLWDRSDATGRAVSDAPTSAVFSASRGTREVVWSPARALPSGAVAEAWDASPHYAKHRRYVEHQRQQQRQCRQPHVSSPMGTRRPPRSPLGIGVGRCKDALSSSSSLSLDPFDWLRQQPQGELRANALAARHGLAEFVRPLTAAAQGPHVQQVHTDGNDAIESQQPQQQQPPQQDDEDLPTDSSEPRGGNRSSRDARITVSCRLQGGLVVSVRVYATRKVRHLKAALVRRQHRFQNEDQFELFLANGTPLAQPEDSLAAAGVRDHALVQVVARR